MPNVNPLRNSIQAAERPRAQERHLAVICNACIRLTPIPFAATNELRNNRRHVAATTKNTDEKTTMPRNSTLFHQE